MRLNGRTQPTAPVAAPAPAGAAATVTSAGQPRQFPFAYVLCQLLGWGSWAVFGGVLSAKAAGVRLDVALLSYSLYSAYGAITSHLLRLAIRRNRWLSLPFYLYLPRVAGGAIVCVAVMSAALYLINIRLLHLFETGRDTASFLGMVAVNTAIVYAFWLTIYVSVQSSRRRRQSELRNLRMELALRDAQYRSLSAQVNPHFLFNSLNSLRALILVDPQKAITAVTHLAGVLRYSLAADATAANSPDGVRVVPLHRELEAVDDYLALERIRFEDRLRITQQIDPAALQAAVPRMMLQHLVENAVKHGIAPRSDGGELHMTASIRAGLLQLTVRNPGRITPATSGTGLGLANTRQRLAHLYGSTSHAGCTLEEQDGTVAATLTIPVEAADPPPAQHQLQEAVDACPSGR